MHSLPVPNNVIYILLVIILFAYRPVCVLAKTGSITSDYIHEYPRVISNTQ